MNEFNIAKELQVKIYRDWGLHYKNRNDLRKAIASFEKSIEIMPKFYRSILLQSICKLQFGRTEEALQYIDRFLNEFPNHEFAKHVKSNCLYYSNRFEDALKNSYNILSDHPKSFGGKNVINAIALNLQEAVGSKAGKFLNKFNYNYRYKVNLLHKIGAEEKKLTLDECDVMSIKDELDDVKNPFVANREKRKENYRNEVYFNATINRQINFWKSINKDPIIHLRQTKSSEILMKTSSECLDNLQTFRLKLYSREPLFTKRAKTKESDQQYYRIVAFFHLQQDIRRQAFFQLDKIKEYAKIDLDILLKYIEKIMWNFYTIVTYQIFPRKFEFINEVYNFVALEYFNGYIKIPQTFTNAHIEERIIILMKAAKSKKSINKSEKYDNIVIFGDKNVFKDPDAPDFETINFDKECNHFYKRLEYTKYLIEKAYLYYRLSELHFKAMRLEESQQYSRDTISQAIQCKSSLWQFIGYYNIVRCDAMKQNYKRITRNLKELNRIAGKLNHAAEVFVRTVIRTNEDIETLRSESMRSTRATRATRSFTSNSSIFQTANGSPNSIKE